MEFLTWSFPLALLRNSSTASTACWNRFPLLIFIISSLCAWYGFSCSTLIQALAENTHRKGMIHTAYARYQRPHPSRMQWKYPLAFIGLWNRPAIFSKHIIDHFKLLSRKVCFLGTSQAEEKSEYPPNEITVSYVISTPIHLSSTLNHTHHDTCSQDRENLELLSYFHRTVQMATCGSQGIRAPGSIATNNNLNQIDYGSINSESGIWGLKKCNV